MKNSWNVEGMVQDLKKKLSHVEKNRTTPDGGAVLASEAKDIVVIGDLMLDEYLIGNVGRISPEAPVPVVREERREFSFGGATNVAINCRRVGCDVHLIGFVGDRDKTGSTLLSMLIKKGVFTEGIVKTPDRVTTRKKRIISNQQQLLRIDVEQTHEQSSFEFDSLLCKIHTVIKPGAFVLISDYAKGVISRPVVEEIVARAKVCNSIVLADPKGPDFDKYKGIDYLKPNLKEFKQMVDFFGLNHKHSVSFNGRKICQELDLKGIIITMGDNGLQFVAAPNSSGDSESESSAVKDLFYPACKREVFDITGAGDTVLAFLAVGLANGFSMDQSLKLANVAASVAVSHHKTYAVGLDDLLEDKKIANEKIYSNWKNLREDLDWLRSVQKKKIVFTNGCFDLLHSGHIFLLQEARRRGDILVVGLNTDDSVKRYKGDSRPIKTLEERAKVLSVIDVVDYVVFFNQDTPEKLINFIRPDVLIKGGDYELEKIAGYDTVISYGGSVEVVDYKKGFSTTGLVEMAKNA